MCENRRVTEGFGERGSIGPIRGRPKFVVKTFQSSNTGAIVGERVSSDGDEAKYRCIVLMEFRSAGIPLQTVKPWPDWQELSHWPG